MFLQLISVRPELDWIRPNFKDMHDFPVIPAAGQRLFWPWFLCHAAVNSSCHLSSWVFRFIIMTNWRINWSMVNQITSHRSCWPCCLTRESAASRWLGLRFRIPPGVWMSVSCDCCVLWSRGTCDGPITCLEKFYRVCVCVMRCRNNTMNYLQHLIFSCSRNSMFLWKPNVTLTSLCLHRASLVSRTLLLFNWCTLL